MIRTERDIRALIKRSDLELLSIEKNAHYKVRVRDPATGRESTFTFASSPSDQRNEKNALATIRRWQRNEDDTRFGKPITRKKP